MHCGNIENAIQKMGFRKVSYRDLSRSDNGSSLIDSEEEKAYSFDDIVKAFFKEESLPCSADAIHFRSRKGKNWITLIEFKTGFSDKVRERDRCERLGDGNTNNQCKSLKEANDDILIDSLLMKGIESRWILEHHIAPECVGEADKREYHLHYIVVIDAVKIDGIDAMESMREGLAETDAKQDNIFDSVKNGLSRLGKESKFKKPAYYNALPEVMNKQDFLVSNYMTV